MAVIGAPGHDSSGGAYAFTKTSGGWTQTAELTASDASGDNFGGAVATSTTTAAGPPARLEYRGTAAGKGPRQAPALSVRRLAALLRVVARDRDVGSREARERHRIGEALECDASPLQRFGPVAVRAGRLCLELRCRWHGA